MDAHAFDADDALHFLEELVVDDLEPEGGGGGHTAALVLGDAPQQADPLAWAEATAALELSPLDFFPPSDDDDSSNSGSYTTTNASASAVQSSSNHGTGVAAAARTPVAKPAAAPTLKAKRKKPNRSPSYDPNRARNMRRHELIYLRDKVSEMEQELGRLRDATARQVITTRDPMVALDNARGATLVCPPQATGETMWERIAARQLCERKRAERENERLKIVLETQLKIAKSLEQLLNKRTSLQGLGPCVPAPPKRVYESVGAQSDKEVFASLLERVHACYENAEFHFDQFGIAASDASCRDARVRGDIDDGSGFKMEIFANDVLPFPVHATGEAAWQYFSHYKNQLPYRLYYERISENMNLPKDTIVENSAVELQVNNTKAIFNFKQVIRRYVDADRIVIAFSAIAQPLEFANRPVWGLSYCDSGCMVLKKPVTVDADAHCVLKSCYIITPNFLHAGIGSDDDSQSPDRDAIIGDVTEFVLSSTAATMGAWLQMIENILVVQQAEKSVAPPR